MQFIWRIIVSDGRFTMIAQALHQDISVVVGAVLLLIFVATPYFLFCLFGRHVCFTLELFG